MNQILISPQPEAFILTQAQCIYEITRQAISGGNRNPGFAIETDESISSEPEITVFVLCLAVHVGARTIEKISRYDEEMADDLDRERQKLFQFERAVRQIVSKYYRRGVRPSEIDWATDYGLRCLAAVPSGRPVPTDLPPET